MNFTLALHDAIAEVCPINSVSIGNKYVKETWRVDFSHEATEAQKLQAFSVVETFDIAAFIDGAEAERQAQRKLLLEAKATSMFDATKGANLAQINTWVDNNFASLNAQQRAFLKLLAAVAGMYFRERD